MVSERITVFSGSASDVVGAVDGGSGAPVGVPGVADGGAGAAVGVPGVADGEAGAAVGVSGVADGRAGAAVGVSGTTGDMMREREQEAALDALLAHASTPLPPKGLEERVLEAIRREEAPSLPSSGSLPLPRLHSTPWYVRRRVWLSSAAAACLFATLVPLLPFGEEEHNGEALAIDDAILVDDALDVIADEELITAICSVSTGKDSFMSNQ